MVNAVHFDSRKVNMDDVFIAVRGTITDGHTYIEKAINSGAKAIVCEELPEQLINEITYVEVENGNKALAIMASNYYDNPSKNLKISWYNGYKRKNNR